MKPLVLLLSFLLVSCVSANPETTAPNALLPQSAKPAGDDVRPFVCECSPNFDTEGCTVPNASDGDLDCVCSNEDNCPGTPNCDQTDTDNDGFGDVCDEYPNGDGWVAPIVALDTRIDTLESSQVTNDSRLDALESLSTASLPAVYPDVNCNGIAAASEGACDGLTVNLLGTLVVCSALLDNVRPCDEYVDTTGGSNTAAVCNASVATVLDLDHDGLGNACDNCDAVYNPTQADSDLDGIGNACDA